MRVYAIGDIHGHLPRLKAAHKLVHADGGEQARIIHVGDLIDRGPDSRGVIDWLSTGQARGYDWPVVLGNHDRMLRQFLTDPDWIDPGLSRSVHWIEHPGLGAAETLASYGVDVEQARPYLHAAALSAVPAEHRTFLQGLPLWHLEPQALFVHAGIRPGVDLQAQAENDLVWIRPAFLNSRVDHGILVVHGHTPTPSGEVEHHGNRLAIDTNAGHGRKLSVVVIEPDGQVFRLEVQGRIPVVPQQA